MLMYPKLDDSSNLSSEEIKFSSMMICPKILGMRSSHWPQNEYFRSLVDAQCDRGISKEEQAKRIGIAHSSLVTWYSGDREPGKKTLRMLSAYYGVPLADLTDDPGAEIEGVDKEISSSLTPAKRLALRSFSRTMESDDVTDEDADKVLQLVDSFLKRRMIRQP